MISGPQFTRPEPTGLSGLEESLASYYKLQPKVKTVLKFTDALFWTALPEKAVDRLLQVTAGMHVS